MTFSLMAWTGLLRAGAIQLRECESALCILPIFCAVESNTLHTSTATKRTPAPLCAEIPTSSQACHRPCFPHALKRNFAQAFDSLEVLRRSVIRDAITLSKPGVEGPCHSPLIEGEAREAPLTYTDSAARETTKPFDQGAQPVKATGILAAFNEGINLEVWRAEAPAVTSSGRQRPALRNAHTIKAHHLRTPPACAF